MDKNIELCRKANMELKDKVTILKTNYDAEHISNKNRFDTDMFIAVTKSDEYNITKCIEAKTKGIKKIIGINNDIAYSSLMRNLNIDQLLFQFWFSYFWIIFFLLGFYFLFKQWCVMIIMDYLLTFPDAGIEFHMNYGWNFTDI